METIPCSQKLCTQTSSLLASKIRRWGSNFSCFGIYRGAEPTRAPIKWIVLTNPKTSKFKNNLTLNLLEGGMRRSFQNVPLHEASRRVLCPFRGSLVCAYKRILLKEKGGEG